MRLHIDTLSQERDVMTCCITYIRLVVRIKVIFS